MKATLIFKVKDWTLAVTVGDFCKGKNRYVKVWTMTSPKTGVHSINTFTNQPDKRVLSHWDGFLANQPC